MSALPAITLQSLSATYQVLSCTLNAVRALYVLETTFYDGFESHSTAWNEPPVKMDTTKRWRGHIKVLITGTSVANRAFGSDQGLVGTMVYFRARD